VCVINFLLFLIQLKIIAMFETINIETNQFV